jgi:hypothetical protein
VSSTRSLQRGARGHLTDAPGQAATA